MLPLREGGERRVTLYLIFADRDYAGPGTLKLVELLQQTVAENCAKQGRAQAVVRPKARLRS